MTSTLADTFCVAILKAIAQSANCRWNLVGDANRTGDIAAHRGRDNAPLSSEDRHQANKAFDWLLLNDFVRRADGIPGADWIEITELGRTSLARGSVRTCDVFISHAAVDQAIALRLKKELEARLQFEGAPPVHCRCYCSSDPADLPPGSNWPDEVQAALRSGRVFLFIASPVSILRPWVWFEIGTTWFGEGKTVVPVCFGGQEPGRLPPPMNVKQSIAGLNVQLLLKTVAVELGCTADTAGTETLSRELTELDAALAGQRNEAVMVLPVLQPGEQVVIYPARPLDAQGAGFVVEEALGDCITLRNPQRTQAFTVPRTAIVRVERLGKDLPSRIIVHGRLQWLTLTETWEYCSDSPTDDSGVPRLLHFGIVKNLDIERLIAQARSFGISLGWANLDKFHTQARTPGELVYFNDGRYVRSAEDQVLVRL